MIAILFISIALFGYVSLHIRIIYSGTKLETRQNFREQVGANLVSNDVAARASGSNATVVFPPPPPAVPGSIPYRDGGAVGTSSSAGLPPNLFPVNATRTWDDHNGTHTYFIDTYERLITTGW